jgi:HK97 family phage major capsid protein
MDAAIVNRIIDGKAKAWEQAKAVREKAIEEARDLSSEEQETWDKANAEIDAANARLKDIRELEARGKVADEFRSMAEPFLKPEDRKDSPSDRDLIKALVTKQIPEATFRYSPEFVEAHTAPRDPREARFALTSGTAIGPQGFAEKVVVYARTLNPTYDLATKIVTSGGINFIVPRLTADLTGYKPGEGTAITESTPTISSITLGAFGYKSLSYWSAEADEDQMINLDQLIANSAGRQLGLDSGSDFTLGTDTTQPNGFITAATNGGTAAGSPFFASGDIISLFYALAAPYRTAPGAAWQVSNAALAKIRKFTDTNGTFLWQPGLNGGQADRLMGAPIYENPNMAAPASASKSVAFGDFSQYYVREVNGLRVEQSREFKFDTDQVALKCVWRLDGDLPDAIAIKYLVSANA